MRKKDDSKEECDMFTKGDKVLWEDIETVCASDEFKFLEDGPTMVLLEDLDGCFNTTYLRKLDEIEVLSAK